MEDPLETPGTRFLSVHAKGDVRLEAARPGSLDETAEALPPVVVLPSRSNSQHAVQLLPLWRRRLSLAALLLLAGFAIFLARYIVLIVLGHPPVSAAEWFLFWNHAAVTAILGLFSVLLCSRSPSSFLRLYVAEWAIFGLPAMLFVCSQYFVILQSSKQWHTLTFSAGVWFLLIFTYALFIPSTLGRATAMIGTLAAAPVLLVLGMYLRYPQVAQLLTLDDLAGLLLTFLLAATGGVIGADKIHYLQREALRATQLGQYCLKERIGAGGMGEVYLAEHAMLKRPCVIKLIRRDKVGDEKVLARFHREVQATARLSHWNTVEILDYGRTEEGTLYYVMEYLPGLSLAEMVEQFGPLPPERAIYFLLQVCDALREAHQSGMVHRDIKPGNIFIAQRGGVYDVVKLLDFGLVKPLTDDQPIELTSEGSVTGSPLFMSPEQAIGQANCDARSDIYSLGAVAYYLLTGQPPFCGDNLLKLVVAHSSQMPSPPSHHRPGIPSDLEAVILKCLAKEPQDRYQDVDQLSQALTGCRSTSRWSRQCAAQWWQARPAAANATGARQGTAAS